ncbi:hypothetical protein [Kitasatospora sp. NPDC057223]|uniref:hypothetical protein n=1 Tax=Kitasatospora sp. NPDC057223 TaxID=3346055 RepID=UPI00362A482C
MRSPSPDADGHLDVSELRMTSKENRDENGYRVPSEAEVGGEVVSQLDEMWAEGWAPAWDGLFRADGRSRDADVGGPAVEDFTLGEPVDLDELMADDPEMVTSVSVFAEAALPDGSGHLCGGGGSLGSEGLLARFDADRRLVWLLHLSDSNEFVRISVDWPTAAFTNNLGNSIIIDLTTPDFAADRPG